MKFLASVILLFLWSSNNSGQTMTSQKDSLDSVVHAQKHIINSAADKSREQEDSIEKSRKEKGGFDNRR